MSTNATPAGDTGSASGTPGAVIYQERLWPNFWIWLIAAGTAGAVIFVLAPISLTTGYIAAAVAAIILVVLLIVSAPRITVTEKTLQVGRAQIERKFIGHVQAFTGEDATAQRGTELNGTAYICFRGRNQPVVKIEIND